MSWQRNLRDQEKLHHQRNEWQAKRQAAWRSADQFKYRQMNRDGFYQVVSPGDDEGDGDADLFGDLSEDDSD